MSVQTAVLVGALALTELSGSSRATKSMKLGPPRASPAHASPAHASPAHASCTHHAPATDVVLHVDAFPTVQAAINEAVRTARLYPTSLLFSPVEYRLASPNASAHTVVLTIAGQGLVKHRLRVDGCGASLVVTTPMAGVFSISDVHGDAAASPAPSPSTGLHGSGAAAARSPSSLLIGNFTVDYDPLASDAQLACQCVARLIVSACMA